MKLVDNTTVANATGLQNTEFSVANNNVAFKVLSTSLYKDKRKAVLRELVCNAHDANVEAESTDPVKIITPSILNTSLIIKDSGLGMSKEFLETRYTILFDSTKRDSNEQIGGFGIGRLSAFSIVDSYTITSVHEGKKIEAYCYVDNYVPNVTIVSEEDTDESSGTTIAIPLNSDEARLYIETAKDLFKYWDTPPILNGTEITPVSTELVDTGEITYYTMQGDHYGWFNLDGLISLIFPKLLLGGIAYDIPKELFEINQTITTRASKLKEKINEIKDIVYRSGSDYIAVLIQAEIGSIELSPSRESIETNKHNAEKILDCIYKVLRTFVSKYHDTLKELEDDLDTLQESYDNDQFKTVLANLARFSVKYGHICPTVSTQGRKAHRELTDPNPNKLEPHEETSASIYSKMNGFDTRFIDIRSELHSGRSKNSSVLPDNYQIEIVNFRDKEHYSSVRKKRWSYNSKCKAALDVTDLTVALLDINDKAHKKYITNFRYLENYFKDNDIVLAKVEDVTYWEEFYKYMDCTVTPLSTTELDKLIKDGRVNKSSVTQNRSLNKPFTKSITISEFYQKVENNPDTKFIVLAYRLQHSSTFLEESANKAALFFSQFKNTEILVTCQKEYTNKRYITFEQENPNLLTIDSYAKKGYLPAGTHTVVFDQMMHFILGNKDKILKSIFFNMQMTHSLFGYRQNEYTNCKGRKLLRIIFNRRQHKFIREHTVNMSLLKFAYRYANWPPYSNSDWISLSIPHQLTSMLKLYIETDYIHEHLVLNELIESKKELYNKLKQKKESENDPVLNHD